MKSIKGFLALSALLLVALMLICSCGENTDGACTDSGTPEASDTQTDTGTNGSGTSSTDSDSNDSSEIPTDSDTLVDDPNVDDDWRTDNNQ